MKKLMIMAVVAMLGIAANAMAVDWKYTGSSADKDSTVYVILASTNPNTLTTLAAIHSAAIDSKVISKSGAKYTAGSTAKNAGITKTSAQLYYVIVNKEETNYAVSSIADASSFVYDYENQESAPATGFSGIGKSDVGSPTDFGAAPEPTSAMLMLLGVAGLALRRRRA